MATSKAATKTAAKKAPAKKAAAPKSAAAKHAPQRFRTRLEKGDRALGWTIARVPFAPEALGKMVRLRVKGEISAPHTDGAFPFRTSLFPSPPGEAAAKPGSYYLLVNRAMQQAAGVHLGDEAEFLLAADLDPRTAELPDELAMLLDDISETAEPGLRAWFDSLTEYMRREIGKWINGVKSDEARLRRAQQMAERLLATMLGERELPPAIAAAFRQRPRARAGWHKMTPAQRRAGLMAVFYYQTPEAREKRIQKLCDDAENRA
ncbi:MAG TPA: YdeI/OmpD-associated family protein [Acidobacteriaceae bacterium]